MTSTDIIRQALLDGVTISKNRAGELKLEGDQAMVSKWLPEIRASKDALILALSLMVDEAGGEVLAAWQPGETRSPTTCSNCDRLELVEIMGADVPGCLYEVPGAEFSEGWKRLPADMKKCVAPLANHH